MKNDPIKVLLIATSPLQHDGLTKVLFDYFENADRLAYSVDVASGLLPQESYVDHIHSLGGRYYQLPARTHNVINYILKLRKLCKNEGYEIVHVHGNSATMAIELYGAWLGGVKKRIAHSHSVTTEHKIVNWMLRPLLNSFATDCIACSQTAGNWLFFKPYRIIHNVISVENFRFDMYERINMRKELGLTNEFVIGHVGRFSYPKNHEFLLDVFHDVLKVNKQCKLIMVGKGEDLDIIRDKMNKLGLRDHTIIIESSNEVNSLMMAMDAFLLPSRFEAFPLVVLEAQASGLPCLLSDVITKEIKVNDCVFLSIGSLDPWVQHVLNLSTRDNYLRSDCADKVKKAGFDIEMLNSTITKVWKF